MRYEFYDRVEYKQKQAERTKSLWKAGHYNFLIVPLLERNCSNPNCNSSFKVKPHNTKRYCSHRCSALVNNKKSSTLIADQLATIYSLGYSMKDIAKKFKISVHKVAYWMNKYNIPRRSISEAVYLKHNPNGDPFTFIPPNSLETAKLYGLGLGLFWGEGNKANLTAVRICNTDPEMLKTFIEFLENIFKIRREKLKFGLQIFTDINEEEAKSYWVKKLNIKQRQFYKTISTISGKLGTYRRKSKYGVLTINFHNKKLRDLLISLIPITFN